MPIALLSINARTADYRTGEAKNKERTQTKRGHDNSECVNNCSKHRLTWAKQLTQTNTPKLAVRQKTREYSLLKCFVWVSPNCCFISCIDTCNTFKAIPSELAVRKNRQFPRSLKVRAVQREYIRDMWATYWHHWVLLIRLGQNWQQTHGFPVP